MLCPAVYYVRPIHRKKSDIMINNNIDYTYLYSFKSGSCCDTNDLEHKLLYCLVTFVALFVAAAMFTVYRRMLNFKQITLF